MEEKTIKLENNFIFVPELTSKSVEIISKNEQEIYEMGAPYMGTSRGLTLAHSLMGARYEDDGMKGK